MYRHFGTLYLPSYTTYEDGTECFKTSAHTRKIQTPGNHPKERIQHKTFTTFTLKREMLMIEEVVYL